MGNEEMEKALNAQAMFDKLRSHIGETVRIYMWYYGEPREVEDVLSEVKDFQGIKITRQYIPLVGHGAAISQIESANGEVLYFNPYIEDEYDRRDEISMREAQNLSFGKGTWPLKNATANWPLDPNLIEPEDYPSRKSPGR